MKNYRKIVYVFLGILFIPGFGYTINKFGIGIKWGPNISTHWSTKEKDPYTTVKTHSLNRNLSGIFLNYEINRTFVLQTEILYVKKGAEHDVIPLVYPYGVMNLVYRFDYAEIPFVLKTYIVSWKVFRVYSYSGAYAAFLTKTSYTFKDWYFGPSTCEINNTRNTDFGLLFGTGFDVHFHNFCFTIEYRYSMGILDIPFPTEPVNIPELPGLFFPVIELRNMYHVVTFGVRI